MPKKSRGGKRPDLGGLYLRSAWEANVCRYLNWLQSRGEVLRWEYEPVEFAFDNRYRANRTYKPDFRVWYSEDRYEWWEVKGWMDNASLTKLKRFAKHYPAEAAVLKVIDREAYRGIAEVRGLLEGWEEGEAVKGAEKVQGEARLSEQDRFWLKIAERNRRLYGKR